VLANVNEQPLSLMRRSGLRVPQKPYVYQTK
jgi:hypothetical protein